MEECAQPLISQIESSPDQHSDIDREQLSTEERCADADLSSHRAAQIAGQKHGAEYRSPGNYVDDQTDEFDNPEGDSDVHGVSELLECVHDRLDHDQMDHAVEQKEQDSKSAENPSSPELFLRDSSCVRLHIHRISVRSLLLTVVNHPLDSKFVSEHAEVRPAY